MSQAERIVFSKLSEAFEGQKMPRPFAFHSLHLTRHEYKRFSEADFVIVCENGVFVLEIKGGGISYRDGQWTTEGRSGSNQIGDPFKQASSALHSVRESIESQFPDLQSMFCVGYGVVFPDCRFRDESIEWDRPMVSDCKDIRDFEGWLKKLFRYWEERHQKHRRLTSAQVKSIQAYLRPNFELAVSLQSMVDRAEQRIASLTGDQMVALDIIEANSRVLCEGGAGTGKTFLAMELARRMTSQNLKVALVCRSPWLRRFLESKFQLPGLTVCSPEGLAISAVRMGLDRFDALLVDEGQDLFTMLDLDYLDHAVVGGLVCGKWCIFHDVNNQAGLFGQVDPDAMAYLESLAPVKVPLKTNCRNTDVILEKVKRDLGADMGVRGAGAGPDVRKQSVSSYEEAASALKLELDFILNKGGLAASTVTILSPLPFDKSCAASLCVSGKSRVKRLDEYSLRSFPPKEVSFCQIAEFKGLENEVIILVDVPPANGPLSDSERNSLYVGMSRARSLLSIIEKPASSS